MRTDRHDIKIMHSFYGLRARNIYKPAEFFGQDPEFTAVFLPCKCRGVSIFLAGTELCYSISRYPLGSLSYHGFSNKNYR
jgi:hypothetical protein